MAVHVAMVVKAISSHPEQPYPTSDLSNRGVCLSIVTSGTGSRFVVHNESPITNCRSIRKYLGSSRQVEFSSLSSKYSGSRNPAVSVWPQINFD